MKLRCHQKLAIGFIQIYSKRGDHMKRFNTSFGGKKSQIIYHKILETHVTEFTLLSLFDTREVK